MIENDDGESRLHASLVWCRRIYWACRRNTMHSSPSYCGNSAVPGSCCMTTVSNLQAPRQQLSYQRIVCHCRTSIWHGHVPADGILDRHNFASVFYRVTNGRGFEALLGAYKGNSTRFKKRVKSTAARVENQELRCHFSPGIFFSFLFA